VQRILLIGLMLMLLAGTGNLAAAQAQTATTPAPSVTELVTTTTSHPWLAWAPLDHGYVEHEFQFSDMAGIYSYTSAPPPPWDLTLQDRQPYTSRMIVRRPADPAAFTGTVVVEWLNVTAGYDVDIEWNTVAEYLQRSGYAFVGVSAQAAGVAALKKWDPQR
jgi:hypothetical protein